MKTQIINAITKETEVREMTSKEEKAHEELIEQTKFQKIKQKQKSKKKKLKKYQANKS